MPELLRLKTPEFEFSIWANDITARADVYRNTITKRGDLSLLAPVIKFSPAQSVRVEYQFSAQKALMPQTTDEALITELPLQTPLFFENTQYQFEWVFCKPVENAYLSHRSHTVNDGFRFAEQRDLYPARLTGTINTGNDVGWLRLPLCCQREGKTFTYHIAFEVLPTKMALHQDLPAMYRALDKTFPLWRFSLVEKTEQHADKSQQRGHFPLMWLANFAQLRARFDDGLKVICAAPHRRLQPTAAHVSAAKLKGRPTHKLAEQVRQDLASGLYDKRYCIEKKQLSVDTPENRFIKMVVTQSKRQLADFEQRLRKGNEAPDRQRLSEAFLNELHQWQQPLQKVLNQSFSTR